MNFPAGGIRCFGLHYYGYPVYVSMVCASRPHAALLRIVLPVCYLSEIIKYRFGQVPVHQAFLGIIMVSFMLIDYLLGINIADREPRGRYNGKDEKI